jgi:hypothetical protein
VRSLVIWVGIAACAPAASPPPAGPATAAAPTTNAPVASAVLAATATPAASAAPAPTPAAPQPASAVTTPCYINAVTANRTSSSTGGTKSSCSASAECVAHPGTPHVGDGLIGVSCDETHCRCHTRVMLQGNTTWTERFERFEHSPACGDGDLAKQLLVDHCHATLGPNVD